MAIYNPSPYNTYNTQYDDRAADFANKYRVQSLDVQQEMHNYRYDTTALEQIRYSSPLDHTVVIKMRMGSFLDLTRDSKQQDDEHNCQHREFAMRHKYPALQDAWDKYQVLLKLLDH